MEIDLLKKLVMACEGLEESDYAAIFQKVKEIKGHRVSVSLLSPPEPKAQPFQTSRNP